MAHLDLPRPPKRQLYLVIDVVEPTPLGKKRTGVPALGCAGLQVNHAPGLWLLRTATSLTPVIVPPTVSVMVAQTVYVPTMGNAICGFGPEATLSLFSPSGSL
jgi:hypothetical protein